MQALVLDLKAKVFQVAEFLLPWLFDDQQRAKDAGRELI